MPRKGQPAPNVSDLTGRTFGRVRVLSRTGSTPHGHSLWRCLCDPELGGCGQEFEARGSDLTTTTRPVRSCGCLRLDRYRDSRAARRSVRRLTRPVWDRTCKVCGRAFTGTARQQYCSARCKPRKH